MTIRGQSRWPAGPLLVVTLIACGARESDSNRSAVAEAGRVSILDPLYYDSDSSLLVFARVDLLSTGDVGTLTCDSTGIGWGRGSPLNTRTALHYGGNALCQVLGRGMGRSLSTDRRRLLYNDGSGNIELLTLSSGARTTVADRCVPHWNVPAWSADNRYIAFSANCRSPETSAHLHIADGSGSNVHAVGQAVADRMERYPSWAPDGRQIAVSLSSGGRHDSIAIASVLTGTREVIDRGSMPAWSPTGEWVAYAQVGPSGGYETIRIVHPDGTERKDLVTLRELKRLSGDSTQLVLGSLRWDRRGGTLLFAVREALWAVDIRTRGIREILSYRR
jgi:Tol biopolymer transport system component